MATDDMKYMKILRSWTTFWVMIISMIVTFTIVFTTLQNDVSANKEDTIELRADYEETADVLMEVRDSQIRMEKDIETILKQIN